MLLQKLWKAVFSFGTPTPEVSTVVGGEGGWRKEEEEGLKEEEETEEKEEEGGGLQGVEKLLQPCSAFSLWRRKPPVFTLISLLFEAVILPFCIPYTFMSAVWCAIEI